MRLSTTYYRAADGRELTIAIEQRDPAALVTYAITPVRASGGASVQFTTHDAALRYALRLARRRLGEG